MIDFVISLMLLVLAVVLIFLYALIPYLIYIVIRFVGRLWKYYFPDITVVYRQNPALFSMNDRKVVVAIFMFVVTLTFTIYSKERLQWMGSDNKNIAAKNYFVIGQVVYFTRRLVNCFLSHPDQGNVLLPLNYAQRIIFNAGTRKLPQDDAEQAVWADLWFVYIYSKDNKLPRKDLRERELGYKEFRTIDGKIVDDEIALKGETPLLPKKNKYMDLVWFCLESMATKEIADQEMREFHYLRNYAGEAQYYAYMADAGYTKMYKNSMHFFVQMPEMTRRNEQLAIWLRELPAKWQSSGKITAFIQNNPKVEAMRQVGLVMTLVNIFQARIWEKKLNCNDPYLEYLREVRQEFVYGSNEKTSPIDRMQDQRTAKIFQEIVINSAIARFTNFVTEKKCGSPLPGKEDTWMFEKMSISPADARKEQLRGLFSYELKQLNMTDVLEEKYWTRTLHGYEWR